MKEDNMTPYKVLNSIVTEVEEVEEMSHKVFRNWAGGEAEMVRVLA
jgi:hypothetical protein